MTQAEMRAKFEKWAANEYPLNKKHVGLGIEQYTTISTANAETGFRAGYQAATAESEKRIAELERALEQCRYQAESLNAALAEPAKKNPVYASLKVWAGGIIIEAEQALAVKGE